MKFQCLSAKPSLTIQTLYQQSVMIFVDHRPNFQWRQLCQTALTCLPGTWSNIPCSPGLVACVPRQAKSLQTLEKYFQFIIYFRRGTTKVSLVCCSACSSAATTWSPPTCATLHPSHSTLTSMRKENVSNLPNFLIHDSTPL